MKVCHAYSIVIMRVETKDILKPGAVLFTEIVDFNDPEVRKIWNDTRREQRKLLRMKNASFKNVTITI